MLPGGKCPAELDKRDGCQRFKCGRTDRGGNALAQFAFFGDALIRLTLIVDAIFELAIPLGKKSGYDVLAGRYSIALWQKYNRLSDIELVPAYVSGGPIQLTQKLGVFFRNRPRNLQPLSECPLNGANGATCLLVGHAD